jgi:hypothetical protein
MAGQGNRVSHLLHMATTCEKENQYLKYNNIDIGLIILS